MKKNLVLWEQDDRLLFVSRLAKVSPGMPDPLLAELRPKFNHGYRIALGLCALMTASGAVNAGAMGYLPAIPFAIIGLAVAGKHSVRLQKLSAYWLCACAAVFVTQVHNPLLYPVLFGGTATAKVSGCFQTYSKGSQSISWWKPECSEKWQNDMLVWTNSGEKFVITGVRRSHENIAMSPELSLRKQRGLAFVLTHDHFDNFSVNSFVSNPVTVLLGSLMYYAMPIAAMFEFN